VTSLPAKACSRCGEVKILTDYHKRSASADGLTSDCRVCNNAACAKYRAANREARLTYARKYFQDNREQVLSRKKKYRAENPDYSSDYREKHKEALSAYNKEYSKKNKEAINAHRRSYYAENREAFNARERKYRKDNPHIGSAIKNRRRASKLNNGVEKYTELQVLETYGTDCHICHWPVDMSAPRRSGDPGWETGLQIDHVIPISKGGSDTLSNVRPSHAYCNNSKGARLMGEF
jgi:5-methylcytosine-specific restriction endonuclease McrA